MLPQASARIGVRTCQAHSFLLIACPRPILLLLGLPHHLLECPVHSVGTFVRAKFARRLHEAAVLLRVVRRSPSPRLLAGEFLEAVAFWFFLRLFVSHGRSLVCEGHIALLRFEGRYLIGVVPVFYRQLGSPITAVRLTARKPR